jgi:cytochrome P450
VRAGIAAIYERLGEIVAGTQPRRPGGLADKLLSLTPEHELLTDENIANILLQLMAGGFDTTAGLLSNVLAYLESEQGDRELLLAGDEAFMRVATEELLRWVSPVISLARTANEDMTIEGTSISVGDRMWMMYRSANHERVFDDPGKVEDHDRARRFPDLSKTNGWITMPITFTPGALLDPGELAFSEQW